MQGLFFEEADGVHLMLRFLVVLIGFWTAWRTGKAVAEGWRGLGSVVVYTLLLGIVMRFMHYALFYEPFINGFYYVLDVVLLAAFSIAGFRIRRTNQMVQNYYWLYEKTSAMSWKKK